MGLLQSVVVTLSLLISFPSSATVAARGCIDVLLGQKRIADWISGCHFADEPDARVLERVLETVRRTHTAGETPVVVFDLDSTLYDTGPRALASLKQVLAEHPSAFSPAQRRRLESLEAFPWFSVPEAFEAQGLSMLDSANGQLWQQIADPWFAHYRSKAMVAFDVLYPGARDYVLKVHAAGATLAYVTGRQKVLMEASTVEALQKDGLPYGPEARAHLFMKTPEYRMDIAFKRATVEHVAALGKVVATFDNEPGNVLTFADAFPEATHVFVETVASDKAQTPRLGLSRIRRWR